MLHRCKELEEKGYKIVTGWEVKGLYDRMSHQYLWGISYCPFCGGKL